MMGLKSIHLSKTRHRCQWSNVWWYGWLTHIHSSGTHIITTKQDTTKPCEYLTHWARVTHICVSKLTIIASDNGLSPGRRQAIIWNNDGILLICHLGTSFSEILIEIHSFLFTKMHLKMSSGKWRPFCLGLNVLMDISYVTIVIYRSTVRLLAVSFRFNDSK